MAPLKTVKTLLHPQLILLAMIHGSRSD
ncbi:hypothetical protein vseg_015017 [Gypsophila vaccaria]